MKSKMHVPGKELKPVPRTEVIPLSFAQQRMWFFEQMYPGNCHYHMPYFWHINGDLNVAMLKQSFLELVQRHESLRTVFLSEHEEVFQRIESASSFSLEVVDVSMFDEPEQEVQDRIQTELNCPFDLETGPLFRAILMKVGECEYRLLVNMHHIISDGWSMRVFVRELSTLYDTLLKGESSSLPALPIQYSDFSVWQREWLESGVLEEQLSYWKKKLNGVSVLQLPTDYPRPAVQTFRGENKEFQLSPTLTKALKQLSQEEGATLYMTLLSAFNVLLYRYSYQEDITVGTSVANRNQEEVEGLIGFFVNTLVMRAQVSDDLDFRSLLKQVKVTSLEAYSHQDVPFEKLVEKLKSERSLSYSPLFQVFFSLLNVPDDNVRFSDLELREVKLYSYDTALFDLWLEMSEKGDQLIGTLNYNTALFEEERIVRMVEHLQVLLEGIVSNPDKAIATLPLISEQERQQLINQWPKTSAPLHPNRCVHTLFEEQVKKTPEAIALIDGEKTLTYKELNVRANAVARMLMEQCIQPDHCIGICMTRSFDQIVSMLAILKVGCAYVNLDPSHPQERLQNIIDDTSMPILLVMKETTGPFRGVNMICLDEVTLPVERLNHNTGYKSSVTTIANIIFTSGSTGKPKGVRVTHEGIVRLASDETYMPLSENDVYLYASSMSFDAMTFEVWRSLLSGSKLILMPTGHLGIEEYERVIQVHKVSVLWLTAGLFNVIVDNHVYALQGVKYLLVGGEKVSTPHVKKAMQALPETQFINGYGPTENTTFTTCFPITKKSLTLSSIPIGRPIAGTDIYVLNDCQQLLPTGVVGELCIGGAGLADGYLNQPELTRERFIPHPFKDGEKLYRTGDLVRYLSNGILTFVGRRDDQVKIRGFRIELGEIENVLSKHPQVQSVVVDVLEEDIKGKQLVAYVVPEDKQVLQIEELRDFLKEKIPHFMVPAAYVILKELPLSPNGKVDRKALPMPDLERQREESCYEAPRTPTEDILSGIWSDLLGIKRVGIYDHFFDLGGHSLLATQVASRIRKSLKVDVSLSNLFQKPILVDLAEELEQVIGTHVPWKELKPAPRTEAIPLSFAQQRMWFFEQMYPGNCHYHMPFFWHINGDLNVAVLKQSFLELVQRHESLRTVFLSEHEEVFQRIESASSFSLEVVDVSMFDEPEQEVQDRIQMELNCPFDLETGPLFRAILMKVGECEYRLLVNMHHIISDGWSMGVFVRELSTLYDTLLKGESSSLPALPIQYSDFSVWQREWLESGVLEEQLSYWKKKLNGVSILQLPTDYPRPAVQTFRGKSKEFQLSSTLTKALKQLSREEGATLYMTLLSAFNVLLYRYSYQEDITVGTPVANRNQKEVEGLIGFFVNTLVMRAQVSGALDFRSLLKQVKATSLEAYSHQDVPFEKLVEELISERLLSYSPLFQVFFSLQNAPVDKVRFSDLELCEAKLYHDTALFDLLLEMSEKEDQLVGTLNYNTALFEEERIVRMVEHLQVLLEGIVSNPDKAIATLPLISEQERQQLINQW